MLISRTTRSCSKTLNIADRFLGNLKKIDAFRTHSSTINQVLRPNFGVIMEEFQMFKNTDVIRGSRFMIDQFFSERRHSDL